MYIGFQICLCFASKHYVTKNKEDEVKDGVAYTLAILRSATNNVIIPNSKH